MYYGGKQNSKWFHAQYQIYFVLYFTLRIQFLHSTSVTLMLSSLFQSFAFMNIIILVFINFRVIKCLGLPHNEDQVNNLNNHAVL